MNDFGHIATAEIRRMPSEPARSDLNGARDFEAAITPLMSPLLSYFVRRVLPSEDSADCLSETMIVLWKQRCALPDDEEQQRAWAFGVAKRVLANHRRSSIRRGALSQRLREHLTTTTAPPALDEVIDALGLLPEKDRELLQLIIWDGFGVAEAGSLLGLKPSAARNRYARAKTRLKTQLEL